jgi:hypothetical protein
MQIEDTAIADVKIVTPKRHCDERGFFFGGLQGVRLDGGGIFPALRAGQARARGARPRSRCRRRHPPFLALVPIGFAHGFVYAAAQ